MDLLLELEIVKNRLSALDLDYKLHRDTLKNLVNFVNTANVSLMNYFRKFDKNKDGTLNR